MSEDGPRLFTGRLELVAATPALAALGSATELGTHLEAKVAPGWPPTPWAHQPTDWAAQLHRDPTLVGWLNWYIVQVAPPLLVGCSGFAGRPDGEGTVECGFALVELDERRDYASEALGGLIDWAFSAPEVRRIVARAQAPEAIRVLAKSGLSPVGRADTHGGLRFELKRP